MKAVALCTGVVITKEHIPVDIYSKKLSGFNEDKTIMEMTLEDIEKEHVERILKATKWHRGRACEILGVSRPKLRRMIKHFGLVPPAGVQYDEDESSDDEHESRF